MRSLLTGLGTIVLVFTCALVPAREALGGQQDLPDRVRAATSTADFEALAADYAQKAEDARKQVALHEKMRDAYRGGGKAAGFSLMPQHCERLIKSYEEQARMYDEMAKMWRDAARDAK
jgi:hypothetical protein